MASTSGRKGAGNRMPARRGGTDISLGDEDRRYLSERITEARGRGAAGEDVETNVLFEALERFGMKSDRVERLRDAIDNLDIRDSVDKAQDYLSEQIENAREYAKANPGKVIGGAAGVLVGASLLAMAIRRASGEGARAARRTATSSSRPKMSGASRTSASRSTASRTASPRSSSSTTAGSSRTKSSRSRSGSRSRSKK